MHFNWIDLIISIVLIYFFIDGWKVGFVYLLASLASFLGSLWLSVRYHEDVGSLLSRFFSLPTAWSSLLGYILIAFISEAILAELFYALLRQLPPKLHASRANRTLGSIAAVANAIVIMGFIFLLLASLPLKSNLKQDLKDSVLASNIVRLAERYGGSVKSSLDDVTDQMVQFLTIHPNSTERVTLTDIPIGLATKDDPRGESELFGLVNGERSKNNVPVLQYDNDLAKVARAHSQDMFVRRYFSHYDPEGRDVADRVTAAGISYTIVGENLAYAPDVRGAHVGLMNSEGHRKNILDPNFHRVGMGIVNGGSYGIMVTQVFAD